MARCTPRSLRAASSLALVFLILGAVGFAAEEPFRLFTAPDRSFRVRIPTEALVKEVENESTRKVWAAEQGRICYWITYALVPRAATMSNDALIGGLEAFATSDSAMAGTSITKKTPVELKDRVGLEVLGTSHRGVFRGLYFAVGERVYKLATEGVAESESRRFWQSFQTAAP